MMGEVFFPPSSCEGSTNEDCAQLQTYHLTEMLAMWLDISHDWSSAISWIHAIQEVEKGSA